MITKSHYSAAELAELRLPGLPSTERNIRAAAERGGWASVSVPSRGRAGSRAEYAVTSLPEVARRALLARAVAAPVTSAVTAAPDLPPPAAVSSSAPAGVLPAGAQLARAPAVLFSDADLTDRQRLERDARSGVLDAVRRLQGDTGCSQEAALTTLLTSARAGRLEPHIDRLLRLARDPRGRAGDGYPSVRTLKRWLGAADLAPKIRRNAMAVPAWAQTFLRHYQQPQKPSVQAAYAAACRDWSGEPFSVHQARRLVGALGAVTRERGRMGPRELKNIRPFVRRDFSLLQPNDVWSADGHTFDAEVQHPLHGRPFRPEITTFIDIATRRAVGWSVDLAESATAVADSLRYAVEHYGIPAIIYVDNGSGYRNAYMNGQAKRICADLNADAALGLMGRLHTTLEHSLPYNSQARGVIERVHQTLWVAGAKELPSYMGREMDREARLAQFRVTRKALKAGGAMPLMPWHLFVEWVQARIDWYNSRAHRSLKGRSPDAAWQGFEAQGWQPETLAADELATLFRPRVVRKLLRAEIRLFNNIYFARELEEFHGLEAQIAYDIHDVNRVWVYAPDGRFICAAEVNGNSRHYFPVPVVEQARQKRAKGRLARVETKRDEILAELHGAAALPTPEPAPMVIAGRVVQPDAVLAKRAAVADALDATADAPAPSQAAAAAGPAAAKRRGDCSPADNYADWLALDARIAAGEEVSDADARWHRTYPNSAQYRAQAKKTATSAATRVA